MNYSVRVTRRFQQEFTYDVSAETEEGARELALKKVKWNEPMPTQSDKLWRFHVKDVDSEGVLDDNEWDVQEIPPAPREEPPPPQPEPTPPPPEEEWDVSEIPGSPRGM